MALPKLKDIKSWNVEIEKQITEEWKKTPLKFNPKSKNIYSIDTPPPYVNTPIHMGHAITYSYMDFFARYKRMKGHEVLFPLGLDRNGLPIEMAAEKKFNISPFKAGREKFIELCEKLLKEASVESIDSFARLGISFSSYKQGKDIGDIYLTDSPEYRALTQETFINLYKKEIIYEATRINNWDTKLQTTIADSEIEYRNIDTTFNHIKFKVKETGEYITIATTRPELICSCAMVIFNPKDKRYKHLNGLTAITPIYEKQVPIKEHPFAQEDKGSGLVMMCSAGDVTDIQFFREQGLKPIISINQNGTMNAHAKFLEGLPVKKARETIINELKEHELLIKQEKITHNTPVSERSGAEIEFIEMPEFYLKQLDLKDKIKEIANQINFYPKESKEILESWIDSISIDWPISRRRFYANPVPLWHSGEYTAVPSPGKYYQAWREAPPVDAEVFHKGKFTGKRVKDKELKNLKWKGDERVLDTWFDSSISELFITKNNQKLYPVSLRPQGKEIVRTWLYYTLLRGYLETEKPAFKNIWIHQHILDAQGRKMSKSLGNVINPQDILKEEGAEALRFWAAIEGDISKSDLSCSRERIKAEQKTINKLLNITKFVTQFKKPKKAKIENTDKAFMDCIDYIVHDANWHYEKYSFWKIMIQVRNFLWETFASHYIEIIKPRAYNADKKFTAQESDSAKHALYYILEKLVKLLHPVIPQVTSVIANEIKVELDEFPAGNSNPNESLVQVNALMEFNRNIWKAKKDEGLTLRDQIKDYDIPINLRPFKKDLTACHNIQ